MKYRLTEEQFNQLIAESTKRILSEAMEDEGFFSGLGKAWGAVKNAYQDFSDGYNGVVSNRSNSNNGGEGGSWEQTQTLKKLTDEIEQLKQQIAALEGGTQQTSAATNTQQTNTQPVSGATNTQQTNTQTGNTQNTPQIQNNETKPENLIPGYNAAEEDQTMTGE